MAVAEAALRPSSGRAGKVQQEQSAPILREPWKAGREESQVRGWERWLVRRRWLWPRWDQAPDCCCYDCR